MDSASAAPTPTPYAKAFLARHTNRPLIIQAHDQAQDQWCRNAQHLLDEAYANASNNDDTTTESREEAFQKLIADFGTRQQDLHTQLESRQRTFHAELAGAVKDQVTAQVSSLLFGIDKATNALLDKLDVSHLTGSIAADVASRQVTSLTQFKTDVADLVRSTVAAPFAEAIRGVGATLSAASATHQGVQHVHEDIRAVQAKIDGLDKQLTRNAMHTKTIGSGNEQRLFNMLTDRLLHRDGYRVEQVNGQAHGCDILISKLNAPSVRVEVKAHGERSGEKVRNKEVERFRDDLIRLNEHGIMVSLFSGIVSVGAIEIEQLPTGKFAGYLAHNNYDVDIITNMLHLFYKLDAITSASAANNGDGQSNDGDGGDGGGGDVGAVDYIRVPTDAMVRIRTYVKDHTKRLQAAKVHLRETIAILNDVQMDVIEKVLLDSGGVGAAAPSCAETVATAQCEYCNHTFTGKFATKSLYNHMRNSKKCIALRDKKGGAVKAAKAGDDVAPTANETLTLAPVAACDDAVSVESDSSGEGDGRASGSDSDGDQRA